MIRLIATAMLAVICALMAPVLYASHPSGSVETAIIVEELNGGTTSAALVDNIAAAVGRDFGPIVVATASSAITIRVGNYVGDPYLAVTSTLNVTVPAITAGAADFSVNTTGFSTAMAPGQDTTFTITFAPSSAGSKTGQVTFTFEEHPVTNPGVFTDFRINLAGDGVNTAVPRVHLAEQATPGVRIFENEAPAFGRAFGERVYWGVPSAGLTLVIMNNGQSGAGNLTLSTPAFNPTTTDFVLNTSGFSNSLAQGASTSFTVSFNPFALGFLSAIIEFTHNDGFETSPFRVNVYGFGLAEPAMIRVTEAAGPYWGTASGQGDPPPYVGASLFEDNGATGGGTMIDFGLVNVGNQGYFTITISNAGYGGFDHGFQYFSGGNLTLGYPTPAAGAFTTGVTGNYSTNLAEAQSTDFLIGFTPTAAGTVSATILLPHGDGSVREPWRINVTGTGVTGNANPTITASSGATAISSGAVLTVAPGSTLAALNLSITVADADGDPTSLVGTVSNLGATGMLNAEFSSASAAVPYTLSPSSGTFGAGGTTHTVFLQANDGVGGSAVLGFTINVANPPTNNGGKKDGGNGCATGESSAPAWLALLALAAPALVLRRKRA